jgi:hypothetical protein
MMINKPLLSSTNTKSWEPLHRKAVKKNRFSFVSSHTLFKQKPKNVKTILPSPKQSMTFDQVEISNAENSESKIVFKAIK